MAIEPCDPGGKASTISICQRAFIAGVISHVKQIDGAKSIQRQVAAHFKKPPTRRRKMTQTWITKLTSVAMQFHLRAKGTTLSVVVDGIGLALVQLSPFPAEYRGRVPGE